MKNNNLLLEFIKSESASGIILFIATLVSLILANLDFSKSYLVFWENSFAGISLYDVINNGLMTIFFLLVGLEIEREFYNGELSSKNAILPVLAAIGGVIFPAFLYIAINFSNNKLNGFGIPMATDIAFLLSVLLVLGHRIPHAMKIFFIALAIVDDICAIIVVAFFYSSSIDWRFLACTGLIILLLFFLNRKKIMLLPIYYAGGFLLWYCFLKSGIHSTIAGVILAFLIPYCENKELCPSHQLQKRLHYPVAFGIMPLFAMANTAFQINLELISSLFSNNSLGIIIGLVLGKPIGVSLAVLVGTRINKVNLPSDMSMFHIIGGGILAGIGFTMSIFISSIAFTDKQMIESSKLAVLVSSLIAGLGGYFFLRKIKVKK
ncbi:MAG: Na+/H+ antiporter NhaA [Oligoflexia bacterium]|nr:Na+/H+ antiporter NhaA [Oligoflexia bacterium]